MNKRAITKEEYMVLRGVVSASCALAMLVQNKDSFERAMGIHKELLEWMDGFFWRKDDEPKIESIRIFREGV